jgi:K+-transporting ATPase A subunit
MKISIRIIRSEVIERRSTDTALFVGLLLATVLTVGALTFLPGDALEPVAETG